MPVSHPYFDLPRPIPIGHRGCAGLAPENTLPSFERALAEGARILESDVHLTRDGVPVLLHDDDVARTTDGSGRATGLTFGELRKLDAGHRFQPEGEEGFPWRGKGLRIPSLEEALAALPGARFNLELKEDVPGLVERTLAVVRDADRAATTLLTAGDDAIMKRLRELARAEGVPVALGASVGDIVDFVRTAGGDGAPREGPMALQIPTHFGGRPLVTPELVRHAHAHGVQVHVWTINDPDEMHRLLDLGVDGLISDHPGRVVRVIADRAGRAQ